MKSRVHNPKYLEKYFTQFPNIIDDSQLSPYEYRLLIHYYRVGECWEGVRKTAEICNMSTGKVAECRKTLEERGFIKIEFNGDGIIIFLVDLSKQNLEKYSVQTVQEVNTSVQEVNTNRSGGEHKNNQFKNNQLRNEDSQESSPQEALFTEIPETKKSKVKPTKKGADPVYRKCVDIWLKEIHPGWTFGAMHGNCIKSILKKLREISSRDMTDSDIVHLFEKMMRSLPDWLKDKEINVIDSKFNEIITEIRNGKPTPRKGPSTWDIINNL